MSSNDLTRLWILTAVKERRLKQSKGARILGISPRQFRRSLRKFRTEEPKGTVSKKVGSRGNRGLSQEKKDLVLDFCKQEGLNTDVKQMFPGELGNQLHFF